LAEAELKLSEISQAISFSYRIPRKNQPLYNYWGAEYGVKRTDEDDNKSLLSTLNFQRVRRFASDWTESVFIRWERERYTVAEKTDTVDLVLPGFRYSRTRSKGYPFLSWGQSSSSTIDFYKATLNFKYLRAISPRNTFIFSLQYGAISTNDFEKVPLTQRFFAIKTPEVAATWRQAVQNTTIALPIAGALQYSQTLAVPLTNSVLLKDTVAVSVFDGNPR